MSVQTFELFKSTCKVLCFSQYELPEKVSEYCSTKIVQNEDTCLDDTVQKEKFTMDTSDNDCNEMQVNHLKR